LAGKFRKSVPDMRVGKSSVRGITIIIEISIEMSIEIIIIIKHQQLSLESWKR
jgi:hypothetical protein